MPAFVAPGGVREDRARTQVGFDATLPADDRPGEAWPLPKRLRVRLQTSAERFGRYDLDERLRLAERLQVRSSTAERVLPEFCFSPRRRFTVRVGAGEASGNAKRARAPRTHGRARGNSEAERVPALRASRIPSHARGVGAAADLPRHGRIFVFAPRRNRRFTRERFVDFRQKVIRTCTMKRVPRCVPDPEALPPLPTLPPVPTRVSIDRFPNTKKNTSLKTRRISGARD